MKNDLQFFRVYLNNFIYNEMFIAIGLTNMFIRTFLKITWKNLNEHFGKPDIHKKCQVLDKK